MGFWFLSAVHGCSEMCFGRVKWKSCCGSETNMVTASVRGRVGDDITQCQDDEGSVRNCSNSYMLIFLE